MVDYGMVQSTVKPAPMEIDEYAVWVNEDIREVEGQQDGASIEYAYHQIQYTKDEYLQMVSEKNAALAEQLTQTQLALCELYEAQLSE